MNKELWNLAKEISERNYTIKLQADILSNGNPIHFGCVIEFSGCMAQGETPEKFSENIKQAAREYVYALLMEELDVPEPMEESKSVGGDGHSISYVAYSKPLQNTITFDFQKVSEPQVQIVPVFLDSSGNVIG